jgi:Bacterial Ig-like domain
VRSPANASDAAPRLPGRRGGGAGRSHRRRFAFTAVTAAFVLTALLGLNAAVASTGVTFVVNATNDAVDSNIGDGQCRSAAGTCTLRAAIQQTNALPGADAIVVPAGTYALQIPPLNQNLAENGDLDITDSLTISGAGAASTIVDGGIPPAGAQPERRGLDRLFEVQVDGGRVAFSNLAITDGYAAEYGGGILNSSTAAIELTAATLTGNVAGKTGGAIDNHVGAPLEVRTSTFSNNVAFESGSALNNNRDGTVTLTDSTISSNSAADVGLDENLVGAGAIANNAELDARGSITVTRSQLFDNRAGGGRPGAAISNDGAGILIVDETTFSKNRSDGDGGAIFNGTGEVTVTNSTFFENAGTDGGAVGSKGGIVTVLDSSFSKNSAEDWGGGVMVGNQGGALIRNTSFSENAGLNGGGVGTEGGGLVMVENSTFTKNSAVDTAALSTGEGGGMHSNSGGEVVVTGGSFTENRAHAGGGFSNEGGGVVTITGTRFSANLSEAQGGGILVEGGDVRMVDIDVVRNTSESPEEGGGGISYAGDKSVTIGESAAIESSRIRDNKSASEGGGIDSRGDGPLLITATAITGNTAALGGAIHHVGDATLAVTRSTLSGNFAENGGGVFTDGDGEATIENATVSGNRAGQFGGGVLVSSRMNVRNSTVTNNLAAAGGGINNGGGDLIGDGSVFLRNAIVANNPAGGNCAGIMTSLGGNVENSDSCQLRELSDQPGTDPLTGPLADNGGPTQTHALLADSPAQEKAVCTEVDPCPSVDQRGVERPKFAAFDAGAYESELTPGGGGTQPCASRTERPVVADFDSWVSQAPSGGNFGSDATLQVRSGGGGNQRALVHFALPTAPPGCKLVGATLRLYSSSATNGRTLEALRVASAWSELGVTWSNQPLTAGPAATAESGLGFREWDVLAQTRDMYTFGAHGFLLRDAVENQSGGQSFHSREKGTEDPPELVLVFDDPDAPPRPGLCPTTPQVLGADRDSWVSEGSPTNNFGSDSTLKVKSQGSDDSRVLVRFPLPTLPNGCTTVASATLRLDASSAKEGRTLEARQVASAWSETAVTWSNQPATTGPAAATPSAQGPLEWTVTEQVLGIYTSGNHGFLIQDANENGIGDEQTLNSREKLNDSSPELVFVFDDSTPETTLGPGPVSPTNETDATFTFSSDRADATFECSLDGAAFQACTSPHAIAGLAEGDHRLEVRSTRRVRAVDPTPASYSWTVDLTAPESAIASGPADPTNQTSASLGFGGSDNLDAAGQLSFQCRLDSSEASAWAACSSPQSYSALTAGRHSFQVRATDRAGNVGPAAEHAWTIDLTDPGTAIAERPADPSNSASAGFGLTGSDNLDELSQLRFQCRLDSALDTAWADCSSPKDYADLAEGGHSFELRAIDRAGNVDESPDSYAWTIDLTAPASAISSGPADPTNETAASLSFTGSDNLDALAQLSFQCRLDAPASDWAACSSPRAYELLAEGAHSFQVRALDRAGNVGAPAEHAWTVDLTAPESAIASGPADPTNQTSASLGFGGSDNLDAAGQLSFQCRLDSSEASAWAACSSPQSYSALTAGRHSFQVRATDRAGNVGPAAEHAWTIDLTDPGTAIAERPADPSNSASAGFGLTGSDNLDELSQLRFQCRLDSALDTAWADCSSPKDYADLAEGGHSFELRAIDRAGNVDESPDSYAWTIDLTAPASAISSGPADPTNETAASLSFTGSDNLDELSQLRFQCRLDAGEYGDCSSPQGYELLGEGAHSFQVRALDRAGNVGEAAAYSWTVDVSAPAAEITDKPADPTNQTSASLTFTGSDNLDELSQLSFQCRLDHPAADYGDCSSPRSYELLGEGQHSFQVRAIDRAGNVGQAASYSWTVDQSAPNSAIGDRPADPTNATTASFSLAGSDNHSAADALSFECRLDSSLEADWEACSSPKAYEHLTQGGHTVEVRAADEAGNVDASPDSYSWTVDLIAPENAVLSGPADPTNSSSASLSFTGTDNLDAPGQLRFQCRLDAGDYGDCESPQGYELLADGSHTFQVRAADRAGNVGAPASYSWTVDTVAPSASIDSGPPDPSSSSAASFTLSADEAAGLECKLDLGEWAACASPHNLSGLADGRHTLQVRATDAAGNLGAAASYSWTVDTVAPVTTIDKRPSDPTNSTSASFEFFASESAGLECKLDAGAWLACTSPQGYGPLGDGVHTFQVRATDTAGNLGAPASYSWTVDTVAPTATIGSRPSDPSKSASASFTLSADEPAGLECKLDLGEWAACASPHNLSGLADGRHTLQVRATDAAGNLGAAASYSWTVDAGEPETVLGDRPPATTTSTSATFTFTSEAGATFECKLDTQTFAGCESPKHYPDLAVGEHRFEVRAKDAAGNRDSSAATYDWRIEAPEVPPSDTTPPETTIGSGPADPTNQTAASVSFAGTDDVSAPSALRFQCRLDSVVEAGWEACSSPKSYSALAAGRHTFEVRAIDAANNVDASPASRSWTIDTTAPQTTIDSGPAGLTNDSTPTYSFSSELGASFQCRVDSGSFAPCSSPHTTAALVDGAHTFEVRATDAAGNVDGSPASRALTVDTAAPQTTIDSGPTGLTSDSTPTFTFSSEAGAGFQCRVDAGSFAACTSPHTTAALVDGAHSFEVRATDAAGNTDASPASRAITVDTAPPQTTIDSTPPATTSTTSASFTFSSEAGATFECALDAAAFAACTSPRQYTGLAAGTHQFHVRAKDPAGNTDASPDSYSWTIDTTAPETTIGDTPPATTTSTSATFTFSSEAGATFECALDTAAFAACTSPRQYTGLAVGSHEFRVRAKDAAGNTDASPATYSWTVQAAGTCAEPSTVTAGANADGWLLESSSSSNYGNDSVVKVDTKAGANARALFRFALPALPSGCRVTDAKLRLYASSYKAGRTLEAVQLGGSWTESSVTWSNQPATVGVAATAPSPSTSTYVQWGVTSQVESMYSGGNHGFLIRDSVESGNGIEQAFHSREKGTDNPPQLVITFG